MIQKYVEECHTLDPKRFENGAYGVLYTINENDNGIKIFTNDNLNRMLDNVANENITVMNLRSAGKKACDLEDEEYDSKAILDLFKLIHSNNEDLYYDIMSVIKDLCFSKASCIAGDLKRSLQSNIKDEMIIFGNNITSNLEPKIASPNEESSIPIEEKENSKYVEFTNEVEEKPICLCTECNEDCENAGKDMTPNHDLNICAHNGCDEDECTRNSIDENCYLHKECEMNCVCKDEKYNEEK